MLSTISDTVRSDRDRIFRQLSELVGFNSVHDEPGTGDDPARAADWVADAFAAVGLEIEKIDTDDGSTLIQGSRVVDKHAPTVLLYAHHDVVPAGDPRAWSANPFTLTERDGRWYGRGAADCKGNVIMHLAALRAAEVAGGPKVNVTAIIEGSEERGGEGLSALVEKRPELFAADAILIADTGNRAVGTPTLTTSLRGGAQVTVTVGTLRAPVHSGMLGGPAPDAVAALVRLLDSLRDDSGNTVIDGVDTSATWEGADYVEETFRADAGVLDGVELFGAEGDSPADLVWARPTVTVTGFSSTPVSEAVNAVPATASAQLNLRVPHPMSARKTVEKLVAHLKQHIPWGAHLNVEVSDINEPFATATDVPATQHLSACLAQAYDEKETVQIGAGGSIPLAATLQAAQPQATIALFGVEEPKCAIHSPDESVDPTEIENIAIAEALFLTSYQPK